MGDNFTKITDVKKLKNRGVITRTIFGCDRTKNIEYSTTDGGLLYLYHEKSDSELLPQDGNKLLLDVKYFNENDSLLFNSQDISPRFIMDFFPPATTGASINDAFAMMHEGDSMSFLINAYNFYLGAGQTSMLHKVSKTENLRFEVRLKKILSPEIVEKEIAEKEPFWKSCCFPPHRQTLPAA